MTDELTRRLNARTLQRRWESADRHREFRARQTALIAMAAFGLVLAVLFDQRWCCIGVALLAAMGETEARRFALTGRWWRTERARGLGL